MSEEEHLLTAVMAGATHTVTPNDDGTYSHSWSFPRQPVRFEGFDTFESEDELQRVLAARAAPLADMAQVRLLGQRYGTPYDRLVMAPEVYRRLHWWATVASVAHLPKRTRRRLLARIRRDIRAAGGAG